MPVYINARPASLARSLGQVTDAKQIPGFMLLYGKYFPCPEVETFFALVPRVYYVLYAEDADRFEVTCYQTRTKGTLASVARDDVTAWQELFAKMEPAVYSVSTKSIPTRVDEQ